MHCGLPPGFTQIGIKVIDSSAVSNTTRPVDNHRLRCDRSSRLRCNAAGFVYRCGNVAITELEKVPANGGRGEWKILKDQTASDAATSVGSTNPLDLRCVEPRYRALGGKEEDHGGLPIGRKRPEAGAVDILNLDRGVDTRQGKDAEQNLQKLNRWLNHEHMINACAGVCIFQSTNGRNIGRRARYEGRVEESV